jgi:glycosyltransferase involved in cell wall biosynthesis
MPRKPFKVLFNGPRPGLDGGPPTHLPLLERELQKHAEIVTFAYGRKSNSESLAVKFVDRFRDLISLRTKILQFRPDLIHHNTAFDRIAILRDAPLISLCKRYHIPVFLKMHGSLPDAFGKLNPVLDRLRYRVLAHSACIGVLSSAEREEFLNRWPFLAKRLTVVKNIIGPEFFAVERQESLYPSVLFISRFIREKGPFDFLDAIPALLPHFPTARFVFIGSGPDSALFDCKVREKRLTGSLIRLDHIANLQTTSFYAQAWAFVFPTHFPEGMPMVVAQAMAAGVPLITTPTRFSRSYMESPRHCLYVAQGTPLAIKDACLSLITDPSLRHTMSAHNRQLARLFAAETVTQEFVYTYKTLLA